MLIIQYKCLFEMALLVFRKHVFLRLFWQVQERKVEALNIIRPTPLAIFGQKPLLFIWPDLSH